METDYTYNCKGLVASIIHAVGSADTYTESYSYDDRDRLQFHTDGRGNVTEYVYDNLDRLTQTIQHDELVPSATAYWRLDDDFSSTAADATGNGHTLTNNNSVVAAAGKVNGAASIDGSNYSAPAGCPPIRRMFPSRPGRIWLARQPRLQRLSLGDHVALRLDGGGYTSAFIFNGSSWDSVAVAETFAEEGWHFFAATFDDDNNSFKLYIDGELAATTTTSSHIVYTGGGRTRLSADMAMGAQATTSPATSTKSACTTSRFRRSRWRSCIPGR